MDCGRGCRAAAGSYGASYIFAVGWGSCSARIQEQTATQAIDRDNHAIDGDRHAFGDRHDHHAIDGDRHAAVYGRPESRCSRPERSSSRRWPCLQADTCAATGVQMSRAVGLAWAAPTPWPRHGAADRRPAPRWLTARSAALLQGDGRSRVGRISAARRRPPMPSLYLCKPRQPTPLNRRPRLPQRRQFEERALLPLSMVRREVARWRVA